MRTTQKVKQQIYQQVQSSGFFGNIQAQVKAHVLQIMEKQQHKNKLGFQYEHPLLPKLKKYPLTSLCMDLIQQFLQSFKFQHTLSVFKKEINSKTSISRSDLLQKLQITNNTSQAALLSLVSNLGHRDNYQNSAPRTNNFFKENLQENSKNNKQKEQFREAQRQKIPQLPKKKEQQKENQKDNKPSNNSNNINNMNNINNNVNNGNNSGQNKSNNKKDSKVQQKSEKSEQKSIPKKVQPEKPPETAKDLLAGLTAKINTSKNKQKQEEEEFLARKIYSAPKEKVAPPPQAGTNKIRGISAGKSMNSFLSKFSSFNNAANSNYVDEEIDQFQQSKDSTRKNPLFSSNQSGFDRSGFDQSVDSQAIEEYEYVERAKKPGKKY